MIMQSLKASSPCEKQKGPNERSIKQEIRLGLIFLTILNAFITEREFLGT